MMIDAATERALAHIAARADDVMHAFTPGAAPQFGDVAIGASTQPALDPLSVAPPPDAYFVTLDGRGRRIFTHAGSFAVREDGTLIGGDGMPVLGFTTASAPASALASDPVDAALGRVSAPRIEADGTFAYDRVAIDPRSGERVRERVAVGRLALARFPAGTALARLDAARGIAPPGVTPHLGRAGDGNFASLAPMRREGSGIDFDRSLERLKEAYVSFDALLAAHKAQGSFGKTAMDLLK